MISCCRLSLGLSFICGDVSLCSFCIVVCCSCSCIASENSAHACKCRLTRVATIIRKFLTFITSTCETSLKILCSNPSNTAKCSHHTQCCQQQLTLSTQQARLIALLRLCPDMCLQWLLCCFDTFLCHITYNYDTFHRSLQRRAEILQFLSLTLGAIAASRSINLPTLK